MITNELGSGTVVYIQEVTGQKIRCEECGYETSKHDYGYGGGYEEDTADADYGDEIVCQGCGRRIKIDDEDWEDE